MASEIYVIAGRHGGVCTIGSCTTKPGIVTSVVEECRITLDQRHLDAAALAGMLADARAASERFAAEGGVSVSWERLWRIEPRPFHPELLARCDEAVAEVGATVRRLPSGPLHDAAEVAVAGVPTAMMFVQSLHGISHNKIEDTQGGTHRVGGRGVRQTRGQGDGVDWGRGVSRFVNKVGMRVRGTP